MLIATSNSQLAYEGALWLLGAGLVLWAFTYNSGLTKYTDHMGLQAIPDWLYLGRRHISGWVPSDRRGIANTNLEYDQHAWNRTLLYDRWVQKSDWMPGI